MPRDRAGHGMLLAALGSIVLAVSVFLPWYGISLTTEGAAALQRASDQAVSQFGNEALRSRMGSFHEEVSRIAGHQLGTVTAHDALDVISVALLVLAGIGVVFALRPLAGPDSALPQAGPGVVAALGAIAALLVLYRIVAPPTYEEQGYLALSVKEGAWLALASALAMVTGALWHGRPPAAAHERAPESPWSALSGWTPGS